MHGPHTQKGLTAISVLVLLVVAGFFVLLIMRLGPVYLENYQVKTVLASLESESGILERPPLEIRRLIENRLYINEVRRIQASDIKFKPVSGGLEVEIAYEVREPILGNVDALVTFADRVQLVRR